MARVRAHRVLFLPFALDLPNLLAGLHIPGIWELGNLTGRQIKHKKLRQKQKLRLGFKIHSTNFFIMSCKENTQFIFDQRQGIAEGKIQGGVLRTPRLDWQRNDFGSLVRCKLWERVVRVTLMLCQQHRVRWRCLHLKNVIGTEKPETEWRRTHIFFFFAPLTRFNQSLNQDKGQQADSLCHSCGKSGVNTGR